MEITNNQVEKIRTSMPERFDTCDFLCRKMEEVVEAKSFKQLSKIYQDVRNHKEEMRDPEFREEYEKFLAKLHKEIVKPVI